MKSLVKMIICVSANPAIDRRLRIKSLEIGAVNRVSSVKVFAGGKAAHVAFAARALGEKVIWIGFLGGANGAEIERQLTEQGIEVIAVQTESPTRTNDEIIAENGEVTEILQPGGTVSESEIERIFIVCRKVFAKYRADFTAVFSGSLPPNAPSDFYQQLILSAREQKGNTILDTSGAALLKGLEAEPDLIKPNTEEIEKAIALKIENESDRFFAIQCLHELGARNMAVSFGGEGLFWTDKEAKNVILAKPPKVAVNSTVGCGDSTVAGFAVAAERGLNISETLRLATACGTANCLADLPGQIRREEVEKLLPLIEISVTANNFTDK